MDKLMEEVMIHGVESYILYLSKHHKISIKGLHKSFSEWEEETFK